MPLRHNGWNLVRRDFTKSCPRVECDEPSIGNAVTRVRLNRQSNLALQMRTDSMTLDIVSNTHAAQDENAVVLREPNRADDLAVQLRDEKTITHSY
jgi:hypothetical protein